MDAIESLDWGVYSHFDFQGKQTPGLLPFMQPPAYFSSYVAVSILVVAAIALFLRQGNRRSALIVGLSFLFAVCVIQCLGFGVPRPAPGPRGGLGSYPSAGVFLFMLSTMLISSAIWSLTDRPWQRIAIAGAAAALTIWVCLGELFLSTHWLTDILGGLAGATVVGWIALRLMTTQAPKRNFGDSAQSDLTVHVAKP